MIILSEATLQNPTTPSEQNNLDLTDAAQMAGCKVYFIPSDFSVCETAENALWHIPEQTTETVGVWIGFIPSAERYAAIYTKALKKGIRLINSIDEHLTAQEFDRAYPLLSGLTPESRTLTSLEETASVGEALGFPLFVRGSARSSKSDGWSACVADCSTKHIKLLYALLRRFCRVSGLPSEVSRSEWLAGRDEPLALSPADRSCPPGCPSFRLTSFLSRPRNSLPSRHPVVTPPSGVQAVPSGPFSTPDDVPKEVP
ncbi:MAG: hypothetical protein HY774_06310 [Acidobacteria bacterium]|nr:hypothetical protein [Acidobacteriota bacterium]